jgi:cell division protease FtsH
VRGVTTPKPADVPPAGSTPRKPTWKSSIFTSAAIVLLTLFVLLNTGDTKKDATLAEVRAAVKTKPVEQVKVITSTRTLTVTLEDGTTLTSGYVESTLDPLLDELATRNVDVVVTGARPSSMLGQLMLGLFPIMLLLAGMYFVTQKMSGGGALGRFAKSPKEAVAVPDTTFADVAGADEAVEDLREIVEFLKSGESYERLGARVPKGVLLEGPPGTGKTLLARATAGEAGVAFFALAGSDLVQMFAGVGASRVRSAFEKARKAERAIIFIDEIDAIGRKRSSGSLSGGLEERENTLNALLVEMDGFESSGVVVIAATNRADVLDAALLRPGRFDRKVPVAAPDRKGREALFALYLKDAQLTTDANAADIAERMASRSMGMTGADIAAVVNEAALIAAKQGAEGIEERHFHDALERVALGRERRSVTVSDWAKRVTAWHEAGHTLCAMFTSGSWKPERVSIVPRGAAGGATWFSTDDEQFITRSSAFAELVVGLGGRAAEELILDGDITQGASGDLMQATARAERMVCEWGMSGTLTHIKRDRLMGEDAQDIRERVEALLQEAMTKARELVTEQRACLDALAVALIERETLDRDEVASIVAAHSVAPSAASQI